MNSKSKYVVDEHERVPEYLHEVTVCGHTLIKGMHATLSARSERGNNRRFEFKYAELVHSTQGDLMMYTFYGPVRSPRKRYRVAREDEIAAVHVKTKPS